MKKRNLQFSSKWNKHEQMFKRLFFTYFRCFNIWVGDTLYIRYFYFYLLFVILYYFKTQNNIISLLRIISKTGVLIIYILYLIFVNLILRVNIKERLEKKERSGNANCRSKENYENKAGKKDENIGR